MKPLFIHIPKNAGMTVRRGLADRIIVAERNNLPRDYAKRLLSKMDSMGEHHGYEHARWRDVRPEVTQKHRAFAIVRNPWERVVSRYTFAVITGDKSGHKTFAEFLEERHRYGGESYFWHRAIRGWYSQKDHVTDESGRLRCDVLRCGTLDVEKYFDLDKPLPRRNVSNVHDDDYREFYTDETRQIIADWYAEDIEFFGFTFDGPARRNLWKPS